MTLAPTNQLPFTWLKDFDFRFSWVGKVRERFSFQPSVGFYNIFNFANYSLPPGIMNGWLNVISGSINYTPGDFHANTFRVLRRHRSLRFGPTARA